MKKFATLAALLVAFVSGCEPLEQEAPDTGCVQGGPVRVCVRASGRTKSSMQLSETAVSSLNVYAYRDGLLAAEAYGADDEVELELNKNTSYRIYALANCGEVHAPVLENNLANISLTPSQMVMCFREGAEITPGVTSSDVVITMTRLFARYVLTLNKDLENCDYQITSVRVKQQAASVRPFASASAASVTVDGDSASAADLTALNGGGAAVFYVPENCQGILLPDNSDPWAKTPENIPQAKRGLCTYLHIEGNWTTSGASADLSLNLMLGADNCTDFNVVRNSSVGITLTLSDSGTLRSSWKVDMDNLDDDRVLSFPYASQTVMQEAGWTKIPLSVNPPDIPYSASFSGSGAPVMEAKVENGEVWVRGVYDGDQRPSRTLTVTSWDGRHTSSTDITLDYTYGPYMDYDYYPPQYTGEYGRFEFKTASASRPVVVEAVGWTTSIGTPRGENYEYFLDSHNGMEYYVLHDQSVMYIRPVKGGGQMQFVFTQYKTRTLLLSPAAENPRLIIGDGVVSESGSLCYDLGLDFTYDSSTCVYLADENGIKLDVRRFRIPDPLLGYKGLSSNEAGYYHDFEALYGLPEIQSSARYGSHTVYWSDVEDYLDFVADPVLMWAYLYGTEDYSKSYPTFPLTATLQLASGEVLTANGTLTGIPAFPSQRYLGSYYNYQLAPGAMRSMTTNIDFTSGGTYYRPARYGVTWTVNHADGADYDMPQMAFGGGSSDAYSAAVSMSGYTMSFRQMDQTTFPACGMMGLKGTVTNPYSGRTYTGYYTLGLVLYVPVGCQINSLTGLRECLNYVPFTEFTVADNIGIWSSCFPRGVRAQTEYGSRLDYPLWNRFNDVSTSGPEFSYYPVNATLEQKMYSLSDEMSKVRFSFKVGSQTFSELLLDRSTNLSFPDDSWDSEGSRGYYRLVRQYDLGTFNHGDKYYGLENYVIEAAYESMTDY